MKEVNCKTVEVKSLTEEIHRVRLAPVEGELFEFSGGQYLYFLMPDGKRIPLSIASAPEQRDYIELHIRLIPGHELATEMLDHFKEDKRTLIEGPYGSCFLRETDKPVVIIAGGTGFSPMKSLLESGIQNQTSREFHLYLGAQCSSQLYQTSIIEQWTHAGDNFRYIPVISDQERDWQGAVGFPHQVAIEQLNLALSEYEFYISGSEAMVMNVYQALLDAGADKAQIYSDILDIKREMGQEI